VKVLWRLMQSQVKARRVVRSFKPDVAVGVGGYASGPTLKVASSMGIPTLLQEQNSYAGVTNRILSRRAARICVAYDGMERFFDKSKIIMTGNPVREAMLLAPMTRDEARSHFGLAAGGKVVLVVGGSLGARTLNETLLANREWMEGSGLQFICQTGKLYYEKVAAAFRDSRTVKVLDFIKDMGAAYRAADVVVSRAGAGSISELELLGKPAVLVPSPNVAEDHQTKNAMALVGKGAAVCVKDSEAVQGLFAAVAELVGDDARLAEMGQRMLSLACKDSARRIAEEVVKLAKR
ncbi:MAG TPA: UDP-N-acetylglucosamine--N-acetylmuramyl-(pentapeptide) pyrophosphoryl-undecaprenol N-acetylglucosamine transferase, partial [Candidatus Avibacteroides faecavium]|nr:UDP-N-acetylglucosamine--N-acetylmuramyl-(pentapeptide) pyrophosphoryl-undecaprenol N-acetylglucosamine transferase [Candidatus Avibacteroides faecavium]